MKIIRNILAPIIGLLIGMFVNITIIMFSDSVIPLPEGVNPMNEENLVANMQKFETRHFIMPFLAHALGTLAGAIIATITAATNKTQFALVIGLIFFILGVIAAYKISAPVWFMIFDLLLAYVPMGIIGGSIGMRLSKTQIATNSSSSVYNT